MASGVIGKRIGQYRLVRVIGQGGMGSVFLAEHERIERRVAIKIMHPRLASHADAVERFFNEARAANRIEHAGIVDVYDCSVDEDWGVYMIMEYLKGESLEAVLGRGGPGTEAVCAIVEQAASALAAAHERGIVHRDLKPANIFIIDDEQKGLQVKLLDFGVAKLTEAGGRAVTRAGDTLGTPRYMSPEQIQDSRTVDRRADVYSLGLIAYQLFCGRGPFDGRSGPDLLYAHLFTTPESPSLHNPRLPAALDEVLLKALAKAPADRFTTMEAFARAFAMACEQLPRDAVRGKELVAASRSAAALTEPPLGDAAGGTAQQHDTVLQASPGSLHEEDLAARRAETVSLPLVPQGTATESMFPQLGDPLAEDILPRTDEQLTVELPPPIAEAGEQRVPSKQYVPREPFAEQLQDVQRALLLPARAQRDLIAMGWPSTAAIGRKRQRAILALIVLGAMGSFSVGVGIWLASSDPPARVAPPRRPRAGGGADRGVDVGQALAVSIDARSAADAGPQPSKDAAPAAPPRERPMLLSIQTTPPGARVAAGGEVLGVTPLTAVPIDTAVEEVVVTKRGYARRVIWLDPFRRSHNWDIPLRRIGRRSQRSAAAPARLHVVAVEGQRMIVVNIYVRSRAVGQTPLFLSEVAPGPAVVEARRVGYRSMVRTVRLVAGRAHKIVFRLVPES